MKPIIWMFEDAGKWHDALATEMYRRRWLPKLIPKHVAYDPNSDGVRRWSTGYAFSGTNLNPSDEQLVVGHGTLTGQFLFPRISQNMARRKIEREQYALLCSAGGGTSLIEHATVAEYESKLIQHTVWQDFAPTTFVVHTAEDAANLSSFKLTYPCLSKADTGSASHNVRKLNTVDEAAQEIRAVFGEGLPLTHRLAEPAQKGYMILQELLAGNPYDYRAVVTGSHIMLLRRYNKPGTPFASGSGITEPVKVLDEETTAVLDRARECANFGKRRWIGFDFVADPKLPRTDPQAWKLLETTLGWTQSAYAECRYFDSSGKPSAYVGADIWRLLCDELERGVWGTN